jgi:hypothetical protein
MTIQQRTGQPHGWPVPAALVALAALPLTAGAMRLVQLAGGPDLRPADHRFTGFPAALVVTSSESRSLPWWALSSSHPDLGAPTARGTAARAVSWPGRR